MPGDPYGALAAEIGAAQQAGWFVTGVYCSDRDGFHHDGSHQPSEVPDPNSVFSVDRIIVGFAKPADDLDHAAAYIFEELHHKFDPSSDKEVWNGAMLVSGVAPHHADRGWPKYVPVELSDTCIADPRHPRLLTEKEAVPKTNPPPPQESGYGGPLDQAGKPFERWDDSDQVRSLESP